MAIARVLNGWLHFSQLDYGNPIDGAFTIGYRILDRDRQDELWSRRFLGVKDETTARNAALAVLGVAVPALIADLGLDGKGVTFAPAVRSRERTAHNSGPLSAFAQRCATQCNSEFSRTLISKQPHESLHRPPKPMAERIAILEKADYQAGKVTTDYVFVVDDLITSGITLAYCARAIKKQNPRVKVYGLAPGKHAYLDDFTLDLQRSPNRHILPMWDELWYRYDKR